MSEQQTNDTGRDRFPGNAYTNIKGSVDGGVPKPEEEKPKKQNKAKEEKRTIGDRIADNFFAATGKDIGSYMLFDWLIPEIKEAILNALSMLLFGTRSGRRPSSDSRRKAGGYNSIYDGQKRDREREDPTRQNFRRIRLVFSSRESAEDVRDDLRESLERSSGGFVTVKELYSLAELPTNSTMYNWGWYDLEDVKIVRQDGDYILEMPRAEVIGR